MRLVKGNALAAGLGLIAGCLVVLIAAISINANFGFPGNLNLGWPPGFDYTLSAMRPSSTKYVFIIRSLANFN